MFSDAVLGYKVTEVSNMMSEIEDQTKLHRNLTKMVSKSAIRSARVIMCKLHSPTI